jgi:hypothetical protein
MSACRDGAFALMVQGPRALLMVLYGLECTTGALVGHPLLKMK